MTVLVRLFRGVLILLAVTSLQGCLPSGQSQMEEEKEPHFLAGRSCVSDMDYRGAIQEFEKALEANPHSAAAHFQLAWLYEEKVPDPAAAIYHYEQFLKLRPNSENAGVIRQHIMNCKQDLAKTILPLPVTPGMQREFEQLAEENRRLRSELDKWRAYALRLQLLTNQVAAPTASASAAQSSPAIPPVASAGAGGTSAAQAHPQSSPAATRTYVVKPGDSPYSIARKNGIKLEALMASNPGIDPRRLRVGQTLILPRH